MGWLFKDDGYEKFTEVMVELVSHSPFLALVLMTTGFVTLLSFTIAGVFRLSCPYDPYDY